ncbi:MAG: carboxypeptidase-like regulatory domain-containing protein, partial [Bacteroidia bacterium]
MRSIHSLLIATALFLFSANLFAQSNNATLFGKVSDETGNPVELANISLKNSSIGTVSNRNGEYLLRIPAKKKVVMVYSIVGYGSVEKTITASEEQRVEMNVTLQQISQEIDEVRITQMKRNKTNM